MTKGLGRIHIIVQSGIEALAMFVPFLEDVGGQIDLLPLGAFQSLAGFQLALIDALQGLFGLVHDVGREVDGAAVMLAQQEKAQGLGQIASQDVADGLEVAQRLGHLFGIDLHEAVMHPETGKLAAAGGFGLGDLVLMMGENEILTTAMDVQRQIFLAHGRAFDMPAGTAFAPGAFPERFAGLGRLPQGKVQRILLFFTGSHAGTGLQFVQAATGELAVRRIGTHAEVHVAGRHGIGLALGDKLGTEILHLLDVSGGAGLVIGTHHVQAIHVFMEGVDIGLSHFPPVTIFLIGAPDDLVVHVSEVADKGHIQP